MMDAHDIWQKMAAQPDCMLIDQDHGLLRARPMAPVAMEEDHAVWFVTDLRDAKDNEIASAPDVCLAFKDGADHFYLSVSGEARMVDDRAKLRQIWTSDMEALYPGGPDDPNAGLMKVSPRRAEYWQRDNSILTGFKTAKAILAEERVELGENRKLAL